MLKAVIISEEKDVKDTLKKGLLKKNVRLLSDLNNPKEIICKILNHDVDIVFGDIDTLDSINTNIMKQIRENHINTKVVFIINSKSKFINIFDLLGLSYIIKPLLQEDIDLAINNVKNKIFDQYPIYNINKILGVREGRKYLISLDNILYLSCNKDDKVSIITIENIVYKSKYTLKYWEDKLCKYSFFRCHKSFLVNISKVNEIIPSFNSTFILKFNDKNEKIPVGRNYINIFKKIVDL